MDLLILILFALSGICLLWAMWMLTDWLYHGRPDRFKT